MAAAGPGQAEAYEPRVPADFYGISASEIFRAHKAGNDAVVQRHLAKVEGAGIDWVRTSIEWADVEPLVPVGELHTYFWNQLDQYVAKLAQHNLTLMPIPRGVPLWGSTLESILGGCGLRGAIDAAHARNYGAFAQAIVERYGRGGDFWQARPSLPYRPVTRVELWNEPNWGSYWCPGPDPELFAHAVYRGALGVHAADPQAEAIVGGLVALKEDQYVDGQLKGMNTETFLNRMMAVVPAIAQEVDGVAVHNYESDPDVNLRLLGWLRVKLEDAGLGDKSIFLSEFGWRTAATGSVTEAVRAENFRYMLNRLPRTDCNVSGIAPHAWFSVEQNQNDPEHWWGINHPVTAEPYPTSLAYQEQLALFRGTGDSVPPRETVHICGEPPPDGDEDGVPDEEDDYPLDPEQSEGSGEEPPPPPPPPPPPTHTPRADQRFFGVSLPEVPPSAETRAAYYDGIIDARLSLVHTYFPWSVLEPVAPGEPQHSLRWSNADNQIIAAASRGVKTIPAFFRQPGWVPSAPTQADAAHGAMLAAFARRYGPGGIFWRENADLDPGLAPREYEVWSDVNLNRSAWDQTAAPGEYAATYVSARNALRSVDPGARAIVGLADAGAGGGADEFLRGMVAARPELRGGIDGVYVRTVGVSVAAVEDRVRRVREALDETGNSDAVLRVGIGWASQGVGAVPEEQRATLYSEVASRLQRSDCGVDGVLAYAWATLEADPANDWDWMGIANYSDGTLKPSGSAYAATVARQTGYGSEEPERAAVHQCSRPANDTDGDGVADPADPDPLDPAADDPIAQPPPPPTFSQGPPAQTRDRRATIAYSAPGAVEYQCRLDGAPYRSCGNAGGNVYFELADGQHEFQVRAVDALGLVSPIATRTWRVDNRPPATTIGLVGGGTTVLGSRAELLLGSDEPGSTIFCQYGSRAWQPCAHPLVLTGLEAGPFAVHAVAVDGAGNMDPTAATINLTVETVLPTPTITSPGEGSVVAANPEFEFDLASGVAAECRLDDAGFGPCSSAGAHRPSAPLSEGPHTFAVRAASGGGERGAAAVRAFTVDDSPPLITLSRFRKRSRDRTPTFRFGLSDASGIDDTRCRIDAKAWTACGSPYTARRLSLGKHRIAISATDRFGKTSPAVSGSFRVVR